MRPRTAGKGSRRSTMAVVVEDLFRSSVEQEFEAAWTCFSREFEALRSSLLVEFEATLKDQLRHRAEEQAESMELRKRNEELEIADFEEKEELRAEIQRLRRQSEERSTEAERLAGENETLRARLQEESESLSDVQEAVKQLAEQLSQERDLRRSLATARRLDAEEVRQWLEEAPPPGPDGRASEDGGSSEEQGDLQDSAGEAPDCNTKTGPVEGAADSPSCEKGSSCSYPLRLRLTPGGASRGTFKRFALREGPSAVAGIVGYVSPGKSYSGRLSDIAGWLEVASSSDLHYLHIGHEILWKAIVSVQDDDFIIESVEDCSRPE